jgi:hypothetical protein
MILPESDRPRSFYNHTKYLVGFEVFTAVSMKMAVFWVVAPYSLVEFYQRFRGPCCLHHQGDDSYKILGKESFYVTFFIVL